MSLSHKLFALTVFRLLLCGKAHFKLFFWLLWVFVAACGLLLLQCMGSLVVVHGWVEIYY